MEEKEEINALFENGDPNTCRICGKPSLPNLYRACCIEHRREACKVFMEQIREVSKEMPKVKLHF